MKMISNLKILKKYPPLSQAAEYNLFTLTDATLHQSEIGGKAAIGRDAVFEKLEVGKELCPASANSCPPYGSDSSLIVKDNLTWQSGINYSGNTVMLPDGRYKANEVIYKNADGKRQPIRTHTLPVDFINTFRYLSCASKKWANPCELLNLTKVFNYNGHILLVGINKTLNVFNIHADRICEPEDITGTDGNSFINIRSIILITPEGSTSLINVSGETVNIGNFTVLRCFDTPSLLTFAFNFRFNDMGTGRITNAEDAKLILWNFHEADRIIITNACIPGTLLAPQAYVVAKGSHLEGNVIAKSLEACAHGLKNTEIHNCLFCGCLPHVYCCCLMPPCPPVTTTTPCTTSTTQCTASTTPCTTSTTQCTTSTTPCTTSTTPCTTSTTHCTTSTTPCTTSTTHCTTSTTTPCTTSTTHCTTSTTTCTTTTHCTTSTTTPCTTSTTHCTTSTTTRCTTSTTQCTTSTTTYPCYYFYY